MALRILILGAGFSRPAGLPLGAELFREIRRTAHLKYGAGNHLESDLGRYLEYMSACEGKSLSADAVDYEEFLAFLDVEHFLGLKGADTWSEDGNETQLIVKHAIVDVLHQRTPSSPPQLYRKFASKLDTLDFVISFNYDTLLECALEAEGIPYRLFPNRYSRTTRASGIIDSSKEELVVLKLHGSIDWCDRTNYGRQVSALRGSSSSILKQHPVFGDNPIVKSQRLTDGPRSKDDLLSNIYRVHDLAPLTALKYWQWCPLILHPSQAKLFHARTLRDFWWGIQKRGGLNLSIGVIGYSLPTYDEYVRQTLFYMFSNYTEVAPDLEVRGRRKAPIRIIDYAPASDSGADIRSRYRFADWQNTELSLKGFSEESTDWLFA